MELPEEAITHCKLALAIDAKNVKALFRRAECLKRLGKYAEALEQLERALLLENNNEAIRESMDDCEDLLDQLHATGGVHDDAGSRSSRAREEDLCREDENALPDDVVVAAETKLEEIRDKVLLGGQAGVSEHVMLNHGSNTFGMIEIKDAFQSPSNLSSALQFVRSQHFTATAKYAVSLYSKENTNANQSLSLSLVGTNQSTIIGAFSLLIEFIFLSLFASNSVCYSTKEQDDVSSRLVGPSVAFHKRHGKRWHLS